MKKNILNSILILFILLFPVSNCSVIHRYTNRIKPLDYVEPRLGMETYTLFSDLHYFSPYALDIGLTYEENTVYLGDIFDLKFARVSDVLKVLDSINRLSTRVGVRYLPGNHELGNMEGIDWIFIENGILFTHGHRSICWSDETVEKWEYELSEGKSTFGRNITKIEYFIWEKPSHNPRQKYIKNAILLATQYDCHTIVFGHTHIKHLFDQYFQNEKGVAIRIINIPRGKTVLKL